MSKDLVDGTIFPVILNQTNLVPNTAANNIYRYNFPGSATFKNAHIAVSNVQIYYSWRNVSAANGNNVYQVIVPVGAGTTTLTITMPDGSYSVSDLNAYLQYALIQAGIGYLVDASGNYVYYMNIQENAVRYTVQFNMFSCPTALPTGWTNPGSWSLPTTAYTTQLVIPSTNIRSLLGFNAGTYPTPQQTTNYSVISSTVPQLSPVSSVVVGCSLCNNKLSNPRTVVYSFSPGGTTYGNLINSSAYQYSWTTVQDGTYNDITITLYDQQFNPLPVLDTNIVIFLLIKMPA